MVPCLGMAAHRQRDPILAAPFLLEPAAHDHASGRCRSRAAVARRVAHMTNTTLRVLKGMVVGDLRGTAPEKEEFGTEELWAAAGIPARAITDCIAAAHRKAAEDGIYASVSESAFERLKQDVADYCGTAGAGCAEPVC